MKDIALNVLALLYNVSLVGLPAWIALWSIPDPPKRPPPLRYHTRAGVELIEHPQSPALTNVDRRRQNIRAAAIFAMGVAVMAFFQANAHDIIRRADKMFD